MNGAASGPGTQQHGAAHDAVTAELLFGEVGVLIVGIQHYKGEEFSPRHRTHLTRSFVATSPGC